MEINELKELDLRLLGYYSGPNQSMSSESEKVEEAQVLSELLSKTFDDIQDVNQDEKFENALKSAVFLLRDRESNLYAYWHKEKIARLTGVIFNRENLVMLPLEYKNWFTPGDKLIINPWGASDDSYPDLFFFEYLRSIGSIGKNIKLSSSIIKEKNGAITGVLVSIGKDFIRVKDSSTQDDVIISKHMCMWIEPRPELKQSNQINETTMPFDEDLPIPYMGIITSVTKTPSGYIGYITSRDSKRHYSFPSKSLLDKPLKDAAQNDSLIGHQVVFTGTKYTTKKGKQVDSATSIHAPGTVREILALSDVYIKKKDTINANNILQHILDVYPDNEAAQERIERSVPKLSQKEQEFRKAYQLITDTSSTNPKPEDLEETIKHIEEAIKLLDELISSGDITVLSKSINLKARALTLLYNNEEDFSENKGIAKRRFMNFIDSSYRKLSDLSQSYSFRITNYSAINCNEEVNETIDLGLQDSGVEPSFRAILLYYKARSFENRNKALPYAQESLYLMPFKNYAEYFFMDSENPEDLSSPVNNSSLIDALFKRDIGEIEPDIMKRVSSFFDKENPAYLDCLLKAAQVSIESSGTPSKKSVGFFTEYIAHEAREYAKEKRMTSAIYFWEELFRILPGFGYYSRNCFAEMLSFVLKVDIREKSNIGFSNPWENKKSWEDVMLSALTINEKQWNIICQITHSNEAIQKKVFDFIQGDSHLKESYHSYAGKEYQENTYNLVIKESSSRESIENSISKFNEILDNKDKLENLYAFLASLKIDDEPFSQLEKEDKSSIKQLKDSCLSLLNSFIQENDGNNRLQIVNDLLDHIKEFEDLIWKKPTRFAVECLLRWICMTRDLINKSLESLTEATPKPELKLTIKEKEVLETEDGYYFIKGDISNDASSSDANNVRLKINSDDIDKDSTEPLTLGPILSGRTESFSFKVKPTRPLEDSYPQLTFIIECSYKLKNGKTTKKIFSNLQVQLCQNVPFQRIDKNPYTWGTALKSTDPTFVGREKEIDELVNKVIDPQRNATQIIVYGQKRCGKSTLVQAVQDRLHRDYPSQVWCVYLTLLQPEENIYYTDGSFYLTLIRKIRDELVRCEGPKPVIKVPKPEEMERSDSRTNLFMETISNFKMSMRSTPGWENKRLVLIIDEFTSLYGSIKSGKASENILSNWKAIQETQSSCFVTIFVGHDITPRFLNEPYTANASAILEKYPITYFSKNAAKELIEKPILINGMSRFDKTAVDKILFYTGSNPYYLQIFMKRMVEYINEKEMVRVSATDVINVVQRFMSKTYDEFNEIGSFNNLINSGISDMYNQFKDEQLVTVLNSIASNTSLSGWCPQEKVESQITWQSAKIKKKNLQAMLDDLEVRKVIRRRPSEKDNKNVIQIIVGIFKEWLNNNGKIKSKKVRK